MRLGNEEDRSFLLLAAEEAKKSLCLAGRCGSIIVKNGQVIGAGYNAPPGDNLAARRCTRKSEIDPAFKSDKTCCVHAEWRSVMNALRAHPSELVGATLYFVRVGNTSDDLEFAGDPYCTHCSRLALDVDLAEFVLWHGDPRGIVAYDTGEYNELSYAWKPSPSISQDMNPKEQTTSTYNATAVAMAEKFNGLGARVADIERGLALVKKDNPTVLEIGCGNGREAVEIIRHTPNYLGIDISEGMIELARRNAPAATFQVHDIDNYQFPAVLDIIFSFASLLHSDKEAVASILDRAYAALNDGGVFYISLKFADYHQELRTDKFGPRVFYFYTPDLLKELAGPRFSVIWEDIQEREEKWFTIVLQK